MFAPSVKRQAKFCPPPADSLQHDFDNVPKRAHRVELKCQKRQQEVTEFTTLVLGGEET